MALQAKTSEAVKTQSNVVVYCRLVHGVEIGVYDDRDIKNRASRSANKTPDFSPMRPSRSIKLNGANTSPLFHPKENRLLGRAGKTIVNKDFWDAWIEQNKESDLVKNNLVFAEATEESAYAKNSELKNERTGFESLDPNNLPGKPLDETK